MGLDKNPGGTKMGYQEILEKIAKDEHCSKEEVEKEMLVALKQAGIHCSVEDFLNSICKDIANGKTPAF